MDGMRYSEHQWFEDPYSAKSFRDINMSRSIESSQ
jgi:hypothetical protein